MTFSACQRTGSPVETFCGYQILRMFKGQADLPKPFAVIKFSACQRPALPVETFCSHQGTNKSIDSVGTVTNCESWTHNYTMKCIMDMQLDLFLQCMTYIY